MNAYKFHDYKHLFDNTIDHYLMNHSEYNLSMHHASQHSTMMFSNFFTKEKKNTTSNFCSTSTTMLLDNNIRNCQDNIAQLMNRLEMDHYIHYIHNKINYSHMKLDLTNKYNNKNDSIRGRAKEKSINNLQNRSRYIRSFTIVN